MSIDPVIPHPQVTHRPANPWITAAWLVLGLTLLGGLAAAALEVIDQAPAGFLVQRVRVTMAPGEHPPARLSRGDLGQAGDERTALSVARDAVGGWLIIPEPNAPPLAILADRRVRRLDARRLTTGMRVYGPATALDVIEAGPERLVVGEPASGRRLTITTNGAVAVEPPMRLLSCRLARLEQGWPNWLLAVEDWQRRWRRSEEEPLVSLGGGVDCPGRWATAGVPPDALGLLHDTGGWAMIARQGADDLRVRLPDGHDSAAFALPPAPLPATGADHPLRLRLGRLLLSVWSEENTLVLRPMDGRVVQPLPALSIDPRIDVDADVARWLGQAGTIDGISPLPTGITVVGGGTAALLTVLLAALLALRRETAAPRRCRRAVVGVLVAGLVALAAALVVVLAAGRPAAGILGLLTVVVAAWSWASLCLATRGWLRGGSGPVWLLVTALAGLGLLTQLQLVAGGAGEVRLALLWKQGVGLSLFGLAIAAVAIPGPVRWRCALLSALALDRPGRVVGWLALLVAVVGLAVLHGLFGREGGFAGIQPAEVFKTVWPLIFAVAGGWFLRLVRLGAPGTVWPLAIISGASALGLLGVTVPLSLLSLHDHSPVLLLTVVGAAWLFHLALRSAAALRGSIGRASAWGRLPGGLALAGVVASLAAVGLALAQPDDAWSRLLALHDRVAQWAEPELFPVSGEQLRLAQEALTRVTSFAAPSAFVGRNGAEEAIPAIENDFVLAFWIVHAGRAGAALLLAVQAGLLAVLAAMAARLSWPPGDPERSPALGDTLQFLLVGQAVLLGCQWLIGWCNPLGLLPVMGQSTPLMSVGTSSLLFFAFPLTVTALLSAAVVDEGLAG